MSRKLFEPFTNRLYNRDKTVDLSSLRKILVCPVNYLRPILKIRKSYSYERIFLWDVHPALLC